MTPTPLLIAAAACLGLTVVAVAESVPTTVRAGVYTATQAERGADEIDNHCATCHAAFTGSPNTPAFLATIMSDFGNQPLSALYHFLSAQMPCDDRGSLQPQQYADVAARILQLEGLPAGDAELPPDEEVLMSIEFEAP